MDFKETLKRDLGSALKSGDKLRLSTIRMMLSEIHNAEIARSGELTDEEYAAIVAREARKRAESIEEFTKAARQDLVDRETYELSVIRAYMPEQLSDDEIMKIVSETIDEVGASSPSDFGKVMGKLMPKLKGKADGKKVNVLVREMLAR
ncbi:MAG: glutamyl-tRNA amidotransferase [Candidatus Anoxymicrobium japonicum]|uniref:Glutamyl-tRNA amidotransferase n=1 Tax=Candidatus Anoxymicrobium japonicum TaxID=2013648 RepID=A0A2N3G7K1_9ACTN|nr:MAG: glutamyl-tRNA amidotransferase [Candidatus Anoxymicrobium japonicum]